MNIRIVGILIALASLGLAHSAQAAYGYSSFAASVPTGYASCATDGGTCKVTPKINVSVYYGAKGRFAVALGSGDFVCNPKTFGINDPVPGVQKTCYFREAQSPGSIAFDTSSTATPATLSSNGQNSVDAYYTFKVNGTDGKPYDFGAMFPVTVRAWYWDQGRTDPQGHKDGSLTCSGNGTAYAFEKKGAVVAVKYKVTGFDDVVTDRPGGEITSASARFTLGVGGATCTGSFRYARDTINRVTANFQLTVSDPKNSQFTAQAPIKVSFQSPTMVAPRLFYDAGSSRPIMRGLFESAITSPYPEKTMAFNYRMVYFNGYGLAAAGTTFKCTLGTSAISLTTDSNGQIPLNGVIKVAMQPRTTTPPIPPAVWDVTTTLTGSAKPFILTKGKPIGSVSCASSDPTPVTYSADLGNW